MCVVVARGLEPRGKERRAPQRSQAMVEARGGAGDEAAGLAGAKIRQVVAFFVHRWRPPSSSVRAAAGQVLGQTCGLGCGHSPRS